MKTKQVEGRMRVGLVATDPLRILGLETMFAAGEVGEIVPLRPPGLKQVAGLSMVLIDASCTELLFELLATFGRMHPKLKLIVLGLETDHEYIQRVIGVGAKGYLTHSAKESEVRMAVEIVNDGSVWAPRKVLAKLLESSREAEKAKAAEDAPKLTARERQVLRLLVAGKRNGEIAQALGLGLGTVKGYVGRLMRKVGVDNRISLTLQAVNRRLLEKQTG
jgi:DNA-binding NarL/FixJ family response regulator